MRTASVVIGVVLLACVPLTAQFGPTPNEFINTIKLPPAEQDPMTKRVVGQLAVSAVQRATDARGLALDAVLHSTGLDARDAIDTTGLFRIGEDIPSFAAEGDLVWEVRIYRVGGGLIPYRNRGQLRPGAHAPKAGRPLPLAID
ncbi:MAG TPA: hypothetical protein VHU82_10015 [Vicinamibacterales bacterium]|jgi:hypothetical protein|nr:hypothetical protein [Vicinamibacterales bacterium]